MSAGPLRVGVIGAGAIAQLAHIPVLAKMRGVQLAAVCDNDQTRARALAERFGAPDAYGDIEDLLDAQVVDAVVVATPNHLHEPHALAALNAGVHVLCERPLAFSPRGVERILAAAEKKGARVLVGHNHRFRADVQALDSFLHGGELGALTGVRATGYRHGPRVDGWRQRRREAGGGAFMELGFAPLDLALWLAGFPQVTRVSAHMNRAKGKDAVESGMLVGLECAGGLTIGLDVNWAFVGDREKNSFQLLGDRGSARLNPLRVVKELNGKPVDVSPGGASARESAFIQSYRSQLAHFAAVCAGDVRYEPPADQVQLHRVVEAVYKSAEEGREVRL